MISCKQKKWKKFWVLQMRCPSKSESPLSITVGLHQDLGFAWIYGITALGSKHKVPPVPQPISTCFSKCYDLLLSALAHPGGNPKEQTKFPLSCLSAPSVWHPQKGEQNTNCTSSMDLVFPALFVPHKSSFPKSILCILFFYLFKIILDISDSSREWLDP